MKYVVILGDGMADLPIEKLNNKTPLEVACINNINRLSEKGELGLVRTVPCGMKPGSDNANLSVMGYDPLKYYSGRSPLEAISMGIKMQDCDVAVRCNLVTLSNSENYQDKTMLDYSSGEITTEEAKILIEDLDRQLGSDLYKFYAGISYRHCFLLNNNKIGTNMTPPHDITGKKIKEYLPSGLNGELFLSLMKKSHDILKNHPINIKRINNGENPANSIWLWGEGTKPKLPLFKELYGKNGAVVCAVDLIKGIGISAGMKICEVVGATGNFNTNYKGKAEATLAALKSGCDFVYLHIEAADECGHRGELENKIKSIEMIDKEVVSYLESSLRKDGEDFAFMILPDHPTPISTKTHSCDPVPYLIYNSVKNKNASNLYYNEKNAKITNIVIEEGYTLMNRFLNS